MTSDSTSMMLTMEEVAGLMNIARSTIYELAKQGKLPFETFRIGRSVRARRVDVEAFLGIDKVPA